MLINKLGKYRMRNGKIAIVVEINDTYINSYPIKGYEVTAPNIRLLWAKNGKFSLNDVHTEDDLVEYIGAEEKEIAGETSVIDTLRKELLDLPVYDGVWISWYRVKDILDKYKPINESVAVNVINAAVNRSEYE